MLTGMWYELETQWRPSNDEVAARDSEQLRSAMESRQARRTAATPSSRPGRPTRFAAALRGWISARPGTGLGPQPASPEAGPAC